VSKHWRQQNWQY